MEKPENILPFSLLGVTLRSESRDVEEGTDVVNLDAPGGEIVLIDVGAFQEIESGYVYELTLRATHPKSDDVSDGIL